MHPILFQMGPITLYSYGLLVALAFLISSIWVSKRAEAAGEDVDNYLQAIFWIIVCGFVGARLLYVIYFPQFYLEHPLRILLDRGGLVWYGGLLSAIIGSLTFAWMKHISIPKFGDILMVPAALGLAIGRLGCFMTGCCYGRPTNMPWAVQFPPGHETYPHYVHPTQLYESLALVLFTFILQAVYKRSRTSGITMCLFFVGYGVIRFIIEYYRGDVIYWVGHLLTASQLFSLIGVVLGLVAMIFLKRQKVVKTSSLAPY